MPADISACIDVFEDAERELYGRVGQPWQPSDPSVMGRLLRHLASADPARSWLAEERGSVVAFGMAYARQDFRFLSFLFVRPQTQGKGVGRELVRRCMGEEGDMERGVELVRATCVDAIQPVSAGLYATFGIVPRVPLFTLVGRPREPIGTKLASGIEAVTPDSPAHDGAPALVDDLDRRVLGYTRRLDHDFWRKADRRLVVYRTRGGTGTAGYGYVQPSGRIGPVCVADPALMTAVLADLFARETPPGAWQVTVPGIASDALGALLRAGLRFEGTPGLYCATRAGPDFERYLPAGFALI